MNPIDGSPTDDRYYTYYLGTPAREWLDVKMLADEEGISIRGLVDQYRLFKNGERHRARLAPVVNRGMIFERNLDSVRRDPGYVYSEMVRETEALRARESLLEERVASLERRMAKLGNWQRAVA